MHQVGSSRYIEHLIQENPALLKEVLKRQTGIMRGPKSSWYFLALPYAAVTFSGLFSFLISVGNYAGAIASVGPVAAAILGILGVYWKRRSR